jgi:hypothetical protein
VYSRDTGRGNSREGGGGGVCLRGSGTGVARGERERRVKHRARVRGAPPQREGVDEERRVPREEREPARALALSVPAPTPLQPLALGTCARSGARAQRGTGARLCSGRVKRSMARWYSRSSAKCSFRAVRSSSRCDFASYSACAAAASSPASAGRACAAARDAAAAWSRSACRSSASLVTLVPSRSPGVATTSAKRSHHVLFERREGVSVQ